jgi:hypothetical protein
LAFSWGINNGQFRRIGKYAGISRYGRIAGRKKKYKNTEGYMFCIYRKNNQRRKNK